MAMIEHDRSTVYDERLPEGALGEIVVAVDAMIGGGEQPETRIAVIAPSSGGPPRDDIPRSTQPTLHHRNP